LQEIDKDQKKRGLIASILLRACYGGMKGDVRFLRAFANTWHRRFQHQPDVLYLSSLTPLLHHNNVVAGMASAAEEGLC